MHRLSSRRCKIRPPHIPSVVISTQFILIHENGSEGKTTPFRLYTGPCMYVTHIPVHPVSEPRSIVITGMGESHARPRIVKTFEPARTRPNSLSPLD